jgi:hypothetical protein
VLDIQVTGSESLRAMARALRQADQVGLGRELGKAMRQAARPTQQAVKDAAEHISTKGEKKPGARHPFDGSPPPHATRRAIAGAVTVDIRVNEDNPRVRIQVQNSRLPKALQGMPERFDAGKRWRHPTWGNRAAWSAQTSDPWFFKPIKDSLDDFRKEIDGALDRTREKLERA